MYVNFDIIYTITFLFEYLNYVCIVLLMLKSFVYGVAIVLPIVFLKKNASQKNYVIFDINYVKSGLLIYIYLFC